MRPEDLFVVDVDTGEIVEHAADETLAPFGVQRDLPRDHAPPRRGRRRAQPRARRPCSRATSPGDEIAIERLEMLKGIPDVANTDRHLVPIVDNTPREPELTGDVKRVLDDERFRTAHAIGVRDHGAYLWGDDAWEAKKHTEVYHFLFEAIRARGDGRRT